MAETELSPEEKEKFEKQEADARTKNIYQISKIIAAINPDRYSNNPGDVKKLLKEKKFWAAVDKAEPGVGKGKDTKGFEYKLTYNSPFETLEPMYFWILDFLGPEKTEKIVDNFQSSPGSGHFSEQMTKATHMRDEGMKIMQTIGIIIKSVINLIYDLRQFEIRLNDYKAARSKDKSTAEAGLIALKQNWLDNVDIKRGNTSIKAMAFSQASFATLIDAFMIVSSLQQIKSKPEQGGLDLNERVLRILEQRFLEFEKWKELSEKELTKRYNMERAYLKSQVESLRLYSRWAKPYLKAAQQLEMAGSSSASLVKVFNTILLELTLMKNDAVKTENEIYDKNLPKEFLTWIEKGKVRKYYSCTFVDLRFRGIPQRGEQHYTFGGRTDITFKGYALNDQELKVLRKRLEESDINESLKLVENATQSSLSEIQEDIDHYLKGIEDKKEEDEDKKEEDINPFAALLGFGKKSGSKKDKSKDKKESDEIKPDNYAEKMIRELAERNCKENAYKVYDTYKKSHGMASTKEQV
jgi:hypothetical protein